MQVQRFCASVQHASERFDCENWARIVQGVLFVALVLAVGMLGCACLESVTAALAVSHVAGAVGLGIGMRNDMHTWRFRWPAFHQWLAEAVPLGIGDIGRGLLWQVDTVLLGLFQPAAAVGAYSVAFRPLGPLNLLPKAVLSAAFPSFALRAVQDPASLGRAFADSVRLLWVASLPIVLTIWVCAEPITDFVAGPDYREAAPLMGMLIWTAALSFLSAPIRYLVTAIGRQRAFAILVVGVLAMKVSVEAVLLPAWGCWGTCAGSVLAEFAFAAGGLVLCRRLGFGGVEWRALLGAALAGVALGAGLWAALGMGMCFMLLALVPLTGLYLGLCVLLGALRGAELCRGVETLLGLSNLRWGRPEQAVRPHLDDAGSCECLARGECCAATGSHP
jgi:O-antigen/teichoic acid export membrane protein